jgi:hypothetical protein
LVHGGGLPVPARPVTPTSRASNTRLRAVWTRILRHAIGPSGSSPEARGVRRRCIPATPPCLTRGWYRRKTPLTRLFPPLPGACRGRRDGLKQEEKSTRTTPRSTRLPPPLSPYGTNMALWRSVPTKETPQRDQRPSLWRPRGAPRQVQTCLGTTRTLPRSPGWARPLAPWHHTRCLKGSVPTEWPPQNPRPPPNANQSPPSCAEPQHSLDTRIRNN